MFNKNEFVGHMKAPKRWKSVSGPPYSVYYLSSRYVIWHQSAIAWRYNRHVTRRIGLLP